MQEQTKVGFDVWGGDDLETSALERNLDGLNRAFSQWPHLFSGRIELVLLGPQEVIENSISPEFRDKSRFSIHDAPHGAPMDAEFKRSDDHSIARMAKMQKSGELGAGFSNGSSDLMVGFHATQLGRKKEGKERLTERVPFLVQAPDQQEVQRGIHATSFIQSFPRIDGGHTIVGDLGGTPKYKPHHYLLMLENIYRSMGIDPLTTDPEDLPSWGLLNIGEEVKKGTNKLRFTKNLIESVYGQTGRGFIEPADIYGLNGKMVDIVLVDGIGGNIALKTAEATAKFMGTRIKEVLGGMTGFKRVSLGGAKLSGALDEMKSQLKPEAYGRMAAEIIGLQGIVYVGHGSSTASETAVSLKNVLEGVQSHR